MDCSTSWLDRANQNKSAVFNALTSPLFKLKVFSKLCWQDWASNRIMRSDEQMYKVQFDDHDDAMMTHILFRVSEHDD